MAAMCHQLTSRASSDGPPLSYLAFVPPQSCAPLVLVHGNARGGTRLFRAFLPMAIARNVPLISPTFPPERFPGYQRLAGVDGPLAARQALLDTLEDARSCLGVATDLVDLLGFSGGAQFVHRFAMLSSSRVRRAVVAAAGWYTYLSPARPFPRGAGASDYSGARPVDVDAFLRLPVHVLVGARDVERSAGLRTGESLDRRQGRDRLTRALRWMDHLEEVARTRGVGPQVSFDLLPETGHSFTEAVDCGGLVARAFDFLHPMNVSAASVPAVNSPSVDSPTGDPSA